MSIKHIWTSPRGAQEACGWRRSTAVVPCVDTHPRPPRVPLGVSDLDDLVRVEIGLSLSRAYWSERCSGPSDLSAFDSVSTMSTKPGLCRVRDYAELSRRTA
jgi:hypothetical protein